MSDLELIKSNFTKKGYEVSIFETKEECCEYLNKIFDNEKIGIAGSVTIGELGLVDLLKTHNEVYWHGDKEQLSIMSDKEIRKYAQSANIYISSANAVCEDGTIVNIDYTGNRLASLCYGHKKVYIIIGVNKICKNLEDAMYRAQNIAAVKNAQRLKKNTPCAIKGDKCYDCSSPDRICRGYLIQKYNMASHPCEIVFVNQNLGY